MRSLYTVPGPERFNFIWMKGTLERRAEWGVTPDDIESTIEAARDEGFQPARLNAYVLPDGGLRYNVVLEKLAQGPALGRGPTPARTSTRSAGSTRGRATA